MKYNLKAKITITDEKGNSQKFDETSVLFIKIEQPRRKGVLEFKLKPERKK